MEPMHRAELIARSLGIAADEVIPLPGGQQNHVVRVVGGGRDVVVRFARDAERQGDPFDVEAWCLTVAPIVDVRTSRLVDRGWLDGTSYLVVDHIPGRGADASDLEAWRAIGRTMSRLPRIDTSAAPPTLFSRFGRDLGAAWAAHLAYNRTALGVDDPLVALGVYDGRDARRLDGLLASLAGRRLEQGLIHGDLSTRNLVRGEGFSVIDWGSARAGPTPWGDLERIRRWRDLDDVDSPVTDDAWRAVLAGAGLEDADVRPVLDEIALLNALDIVRWALDVRPDRLASQVVESRIIVGGILADESS